MTLRLNPALNCAALASDYAVRKRLQLRDFLDPASAEQVYESVHELPWGMVYNDGPQVHQLSPEQVAAMDDQQADDITAGIQERAREQFQFLYAFYPVHHAYLLPTGPRYRAFEFLELLNNPAVIDFIRDLTGLDQIRWADAQATWYRPGHFLTAHDDEDPVRGRVAAYVMNLSRDWNRDWGGLLQFFDANDNVEQAYKPAFNTLNIFTVPQLHSVSMVSTYVTAERLAVTGWFRTDEPPQRIAQLASRTTT
ncbi:MAG: 2OG-Fe(II) oxygenase [Sphingomonas sp.]|nr:2OG-Fe(II) oxygenase [Sphingomonas sp.]